MPDPPSPHPTPPAEHVQSGLSDPIAWTPPVHLSPAQLSWYQILSDRAVADLSEIGCATAPASIVVDGPKGGTFARIAFDPGSRTWSYGNGTGTMIYITDAAGKGAKDTEGGDA